MKRFLLLFVVLAAIVVFGWLVAEKIPGNIGNGFIYLAAAIALLMAFNPGKKPGKVKEGDQ